MTELKVSSGVTWRQRWDIWVSYLPALLMALVALWTFWLTQTVDVRESDRSSAAARAEGPDYELTGFVARSFNAQGTLTAVVRGEHAVHDPGPGLLVVTDARMESHRVNGLTRARAKELWVYDDRERFELRGDVQVVRESANLEPLQFEGNRVLVHSQPRVMESPEPVRITRGADVIVAASMMHEESTGVVVLKGAVKATFAPRNKKTSGKQKRRS